MREEITLQLHQETIKNLLIFYESDDASEAKRYEERCKRKREDSISNITIIQVMQCYFYQSKALLKMFVT